MREQWLQFAKMACIQCGRHMGRPPNAWGEYLKFATALQNHQHTKKPELGAQSCWTIDIWQKEEQCRPRAPFKWPLQWTEHPPAKQISPFKQNDESRVDRKTMENHEDKISHQTIWRSIYRKFHNDKTTKLTWQDLIPPVGVVWPILAVLPCATVC